MPTEDDTQKQPDVEATNGVSMIRFQGHNYRTSASKQMYIMRGVSGSGKSYTAKQLVGSGKIYSTDDYFMQQGEYRFDPTKISAAHEWNQRRVWNAAKRGVNPLVVDNTTTQAWEAKAYVVIGMDNGYDIEFVEPTSSWWQKFRPNLSEPELETLVEELAQRNQHGVPAESIRRMLERWEHNIDPMTALRATRPF